MESYVQEPVRASSTSHARDTAEECSSAHHAVERRVDARLRLGTADVLKK